MAEVNFTQRIENYFSLWGAYPVMGAQGVENRRQVVLYFGVVLGAVAKAAYDFLSQAAGSFTWSDAFIALIVSMVVFPQLYYTAGLNKARMSFAHFTLAFQNGFFWGVAFDQLANRATS
ncbi:hypothetical protein [Mesorhizobium neociceri]|uniref:Uncharacterized protein n=1 Tax=Mesorhizobium neociceri TaxID=1307853 RepID=A0A838BC92_9HYPH|nr:hypothetical protein [Mesorhizobium neociceri]MBA1144186.1 hypothetical protein [Mesorhizobium neociceri]